MNEKSIINYNIFLYITCQSFVLPTLLSLYMKRIDVFWMILSILITSLLRWGNGETVLYQYIDHSWVKIVFIHMIISSIYIIKYIHIEAFKGYCLLGFLLNILFFFCLELAVYKSNFPELFIPYHMIVHFYTCFGFLFSLTINYNYNHTWFLLLNLFNSFLRYIKYIFFNINTDQ
jgi:hypothetical protein